MKSEYTKGKWRISNGSIIYSDDTFEGIADCTNTSCIKQNENKNKANAQRIVTAVNNHDELLEALKDYVQWHNIDLGLKAYESRQKRVMDLINKIERKV